MVGKEDDKFRLEHVNFKVSEKHACVYIHLCLLVQQVLDT